VIQAEPLLPNGTATRAGLGQTRFIVLLLGILLLSFAVRVAAAVVWQGRLVSADTLAWGDSGTYWEIAENWAERGSYRFGEPPQFVFRAPGYPAVLAASMVAADAFGQPFRVLQARLIGCVFGTVAVGFLIAWTSDLTGDRRIGLLAGLGMAVEPGAIAMSIFVLAEAVFIPLLVLSLWAWTMAWRQPLAWVAAALAFLAGLLTGAGILVRPSWLLFAPCALGIGFVCYSARPRQVAIGLAMGCGIALSLLPWWYRNYELAGRWIPTTLQVGASLYDGWNPAADGSSDMTHGYRVTRPLLQHHRAWLEQQLPHLDAAEADRAAIELEVASNDLLLSTAWQWGREHPAELARLFLVKVWRTWRPWPAATEVNSRALTTITVLGFIPLMGLSLIGIWRYARRDYAWAICLWPAVYITLLHGVFVGSLRYRQPAMIPLIILAAVVVADWIWRRQKGQETLPSSRSE
jgi:4-amino-4-deoxy-L-arabinose transferase-like glycosyltransferase